MIVKIREILLTQYIGAILIALMGWQAVVVLVGTAIRDLGWFVRQQQNASVVGSAGTTFPWVSLIDAAITMFLYLLVGYLLARWLYPLAQTKSESNAEAQERMPPA